jgi:hypothetical protein
MEGIRTVGPAAGFRWLWDAINIGRRGAGAIFGGAGLLLLIGALAAILFMVAAALAVTAFRGSAAVSFIVGLGFVLPMLAWMALGFVGYLRLIDTVESGRRASATDALRGFADFGTGKRAFAALFAVMLAQQVLLVGYVAWLAPDVGRWYLDLLQGGFASGHPPPVPHGIWKLYLFNLTVGVLCNGAQAIAIAQVALRGRGTAAALRDGISGALRNLPALLVLMVCGIVLAVALLLLVVVVVMLLMMVGKLVALWLAAILAFVLYMALLVAAIAVGGAAMYYMWRDIAGPSGAMPAAVAA